MMRLLLLAPSRVSRGDAIVAADLARALPRSGFQVGFLSAPEAVAHLHDLGMPTLPLTGSTPAENLALLDRIVQGFNPDCLIAADAFALQQSSGWSGLTVEMLRERYGRSVASFDRLGWQAAGYTADFYGGRRVRVPALLDGCDVLIRTSPPHPMEPAPPGVAVAALHLDGLRDGGRRPPGTADTDAGGLDNDRPTVFLVNSPWEYRNPARSLPVAQLIDGLPRVIHSHLAALDRPLRVVHVGPRRWRFPVADQIDYQHFSRLPYPMFRDRLASAELFLTTNLLSVTLAQAVLAGTPALVLHNHAMIGPRDIPGWVSAAAPLLRIAYPFRVAPLGWHELLEPLLAGNPYQNCFAAEEIFDRTAVLRALTELLDDGPVRSRFRRNQQHYHDRLAGLPPAGEALAAAVTR
jgi:hypothetical protein